MEDILNSITIFIILGIITFIFLRRLVETNPTTEISSINFIDTSKIKTFNIMCSNDRVRAVTFINKMNMEILNKNIGQKDIRFLLENFIKVAKDKLLAQKFAVELMRQKVIRFLPNTYILQLREGYEREWGLESKEETKSWKEKEEEYEDEITPEKEKIKKQPSSVQNIGLKEVFEAFINPQKMEQLLQQIETEEKKK